MQIGFEKVRVAIGEGKSAQSLLPMIFFIIAFIAVPVKQLHGLSLMPGNLGDARLNNYFLENAYQFFFGKSDSLWHLGFFYPFPYVLGFSDNLFGSSPIYAMARFFGMESNTAYQVWFLVGYAINFTAAYYALRCLGGGRLGSSVGALIFAFALPTTAHAGHAQLHYRFGVPLATAFFIFFLERKDFHLLVISGAWLVWQFYCSIYIGFFTLLLLVVGFIIHFLYVRYWSKTPLLISASDFAVQWSVRSRNEKLWVLCCLAFLLAALILLFYPYLRVTQLYGAKRSWDEIATMLPRPQSYLLSDASLLWSLPRLKIFLDIPMRHEHQMFIGALPMLLAVMGVFVGIRSRRGHSFTVMTGMLGAVIALTLYVGGFSLWYFLHKMPLASAIRAMTRVDQVILFPVAYLAVISVDHLQNRWQWSATGVVAIIMPLLVFEFTATSMSVSSKKEWRERLSAYEAAIPRQLKNDAILFFAQSKGPWYADEIDAMWVSLNHGANTLNGYSGGLPPGYSIEYGNDCFELPKRILSFMLFSDQTGNDETYFELINRVIPIGFDNCDQQWLTVLPSITKIDREYTAEEIGRLSYSFEGKRQINGQTVVLINILNDGSIPIAAKSMINKPMRVSWRFLNESGEPTSGWENRRDIPFDIPAKGNLLVQLPIDHNLEIKNGFLQISMVQEAVFWAHDIGVKEISIPWK